MGYCELLYNLQLLTRKTLFFKFEKVLPLYNLPDNFLDKELSNNL